MTEIYLVRHGYSKSNEMDVFLGQENVDLTEKGVNQATETAKFLNEFDITKIYASDLDRTCQTAEPLSKLKGLPIVKRERLREIDGGDWDWVSYKEIGEKYPNDWRLWGFDVCSSYTPNGETFYQVQQRVYAEMENIACENDGKQVAVYSHGTSIKSFICKVLNVTGKTANDLPYPSNASVTKLIYENGKFTIDFYSKADFLGDLSTNLTINVEGEII